MGEGIWNQSDKSMIYRKQKALEILYIITKLPNNYYNWALELNTQAVKEVYNGNGHEMFANTYTN